jgi:hypothetical protein
MTSMASRGDWLIVQELLENGDPEFVDRLRSFAAPDVLGPFAGRWYSKPSPAARRLLSAYLERPLNAPRHEPLIKKLFKMDEEARDEGRQLRSILHRARTEGLDRQNREGHADFRAWLRGKIAFVKMAPPDVGARLLAGVLALERNDPKP